MKKLKFIDDDGERVWLEPDTIVQLKRYLTKKPNTVVVINTNYMRNSNRFKFDLLSGLDIRKLMIASCYSSHDELAGLHTLSGLRELDARLCSPERHPDFSCFKKLTTLEYCWGKETKNLFERTTLKNLRLSKYKSKTGHLTDFSQLTNLVTLSIVESNIKTLKGLEKLTRLKDLTIAYNKVLTLKNTASLPQVESLKMESCKKVDLDLIRVFPNLNKLEIINHSDIDSLRPLLDGLRKLKDLHIGGVRINESDNRYWLNYKRFKRFYVVTRKHQLLTTDDVRKPIKQS